MKYLSFPGLGIGPFHIERVAFTIFGRDVAWYGILITFGMIIAVLNAVRLAKKEGISTDDITDFAFIVILAGIAGARAYYVIFTWNDYGYLVTDGSFFYNLWHTFVNCIAMWEGGLAIYGGVLAGLLTGFLFARKKKIPLLKIFDILAAVVLFGQVIGRWGNFVNIEAYGCDTTLPWRMGILTSYSGEIPADGVWSAARYVHPTFLYESLWNLVALLIVHLGLYPKKKFDGEIFCFYLIWYGFGRMLIESLRLDSLMLGNLRVSQGVGFLSVIVGILLLVRLASQAKKRGEEDGGGEYRPVYAAGTAGDRASAPAPESAEEGTPENAAGEDGPESSEEPEKEEEPEVSEDPGEPEGPEKIEEPEGSEKTTDPEESGEPEGASDGENH